MYCKPVKIILTKLKLSMANLMQSAILWYCKILLMALCLMNNCLIIHYLVQTYKEMYIVDIRFHDLYINSGWYFVTISTVVSLLITIQLQSLGNAKISVESILIEVSLISIWSNTTPSQSSSIQPTGHPEQKFLRQVHYYYNKIWRRLHNYSKTFKRHHQVYFMSTPGCLQTLYEFSQGRC